MRTGKELKEWARRAIRLGIGLPISIVTTTLGAVFLLMFLAVGLGLVAAILGAPFRGRSDRRYLRWEHWDHEERGPRGPGKEAR